MLFVWLSLPVIVVPVSVLSNWEKQIQDHCTENSLTWYTYYGTNRDKPNASNLASYDVVFTTYQTVTGEHVEPGETANSKKKKKVERPLFATQWKVCTGLLSAQSF
jgi:SWI/SNF-related matrix-associated actin-dependent regulator of chromatin subfamily A3